MQKLSACRKRFSDTQRRFSTSSRCMMAICPAGPPKLMKPNCSQKRNASLKEMVGGVLISGGFMQHPSGPGRRRTACASGPLELEHRTAGARIGQEADLLAVLQAKLVQNLQPVFHGQGFKVPQCADADVGGV